ncbi:MAG: polysaccharide pyruvyl transferase family protein [Actinomycetia bacterium]|nr:polysaccharide pyruvyl transferase family protein [Actinomycetes bacterium]
MSPPERDAPTPPAAAALGAETTAAVGGAIGVRRRVAFVNFPDIANVGDPLLWLGARTIFDDIGVSLVYQARPKDFDPDAVSELDDLDMIVLNGGGNFGDVWPGQHQTRQRVFNRFPDRAILQLPQTLWYNNKANLMRDAEMISRLDSAVLMWRERRSYELAERVFDATNILVPDTAFGYQTTAFATGGSGITWLLRTDRESIHHDPQRARATCPDTQWVTENDQAGSDIDVLRTSLTEAHLNPIVNAQAIDTIHRELAMIRVQRGTDLLGLGAVTITDRLHGVILSAAINIPVIALDNRSHKVHGVIDTHLSHLPLVSKATSLEDAASQANKLLERPV